MTNRLTRISPFSEFKITQPRLSQGCPKVPQRGEGKDSKMGVSQTSENRVIPAVLPMKSDVLEPRMTVSGGTRHWHIWSFCQFCPQYANVVIFPRKCYYEAQCPIPALVHMISHHGPRTAVAQSSTPTQCMLPETRSHPSLDTENHAQTLCAQYDNLSPPTGSTSAESGATPQNSPPKVRYRSTRPLASCLCADELRRKAYQERVSGERESRGVSSMRMYTAYVRIGREGVTLSFEC
jgi:hypothetical protein